MVDYRAVEGVAGETKRMFMTRVQIECEEEVLLACSPKTDPGLVRVPMTPGRGTLETLDEAKTAHS